MGRDHTLYAVEPGYVRFYKPNPLPSDEEQSVDSVLSSVAKKSLAISPLPTQTVLPIVEQVKCHPSSSRRKQGRRYVGVVLDSEDQLPAPLGVPHKRRLGRIDLTQERTQGNTAEEMEVPLA